MEIALLLLIGVFLILLLPYLAKTLPLRKIRDSDIPKQGSLVRLASGNLYYLIHKPDALKNNEQVLVLVHGFSTPSFVWGGLLNFFREAGYTVLVYDHFGRGYSDRPRTQYTKDFYVESLKELLDELGFHNPINLVGNIIVLRIKV